MDRDTYRFLQQARDVHEYSLGEARSLAANGDYGPWTADVLARVAPLTRIEVSRSR